MNLKRLAVILLSGLLLTGCFDPGSSKTQSPSASVTIDVPALARSHDGISPAFIDTSTKELLLQVRRSVIGGYDEAPQALANWYKCILGYNPATTNPAEFYETLPSIIPGLVGQSLSGLEAIRPACGLYPVGHDGHAIVDEKLISSTSPSAHFDLPPGKYRFTVTQRSADGDIAITTAYATLTPGSNALVIQLMYGDWQFDQPLTASLLGGFEDPDHAVNMRLASLLEELGAQSEVIDALRAIGGYWGDTNNPGSVWGVINENQPLALQRIQLAGGRTASTSNDPLVGWGRNGVLERLQGNEAYFMDIEGSQEPVNWLLSILPDPSSSSGLMNHCSDFYCFLDRYGQVALSAQGTEWHFSGDESLGMGWLEVSDNGGISRTGQTGIASPALLLQQYKQQRNRHRISLGEVAFIENNGRGFEQKAGLYFYGLEPQQALLGTLVANQQKSAWQITNAEASVSGNDDLAIYLNLSHLTVKILGTGFPDLRPTTLDGNKVDALVVEYIEYGAASFSDFWELPIDEAAPLLASIPNPLPENSYVLSLDVPVKELGFLVSDQSSVTQRINRVLDQLYQQQQTTGLPSTSVSSGCFILYEQRFPTSLEVYKTGGAWQLPSTFDAGEMKPSALWVCVHRTGLTAQNL